MLLFVLLNLSSSGIAAFSVTALLHGYGIDLATASTALTAFLFASAFGVLAGGLLADRARNHGLVAAVAIGVDTEGEGGRVGSLVTSPLLLPAALLTAVAAGIDADREGWRIGSLITLLLLPSIAGIGEVGLVAVALEIDSEREGRGIGRRIPYRLLWLVELGAEGEGRGSEVHPPATAREGFGG
jgi:MFS family permease